VDCREPSATPGLVELREMPDHEVPMERREHQVCLEMMDLLEIWALRERKACEVPGDSPVLRALKEPRESTDHRVQLEPPAPSVTRDVWEHQDSLATQELLDQRENKVVEVAAVVVATEANLD